MKHKLLLLIGVGVVIGLGALALVVLVPSGQTDVSQRETAARPLTPPEPPRQGNMPSIRTSEPRVNSTETPPAVADTGTAPSQSITTKTLDDSASTLANPVKVATSDGRHLLLVGQPKGQNEKHPRKIIFSLPGHGSTAEQDYAAWKSHITTGDYALASIDWWDGAGEKITDYYRPDEVLREIRFFLDTYGYQDDDFVVLEGFSRGSANTYGVKAYDVVSGHAVIDAVISASGKYQSDFPLTPDQSIYAAGKLYQGVPWILVCGEKDDNPERDGCIGMNETKTYLTGMGAQVLNVLSDPRGGHGAFHQSPLKLPAQALKLLDALPAAR